MTLFDAATEIGGQFNIAKQIPGEEFNETLRYFGRRIETAGVTLQLNTRVDAEAWPAVSTMSCWPPASPRARWICIAERQGNELPRPDRQKAGRRQDGGDHRRRRHRLRRRSSSPIRTTPQRVERSYRMGIDTAMTTVAA